MRNDNLLSTWKAECDLLSSDLAPRKFFDRKDIEFVYNTLVNYFSLQYFNPQSDANVSQGNWIHYLLVNHKRFAAIIALFEIAQLLEYLSSLSIKTQSKLKNALSDNRQFRDLLFEVYISRLFAYNNIPHDINPIIQKERDLRCTINNIDYLCECRKIYAPNVNQLGIEKYLLEVLYLKTQNLDKCSGMIGTVKFADPNNLNLKRVFAERIDLFFSNFTKGNYSSIDYHQTDIQGDFHVIDYDLSKRMEIENSNEYDVVFFIHPTDNINAEGKVHFQMGLRANFKIPQFKVDRKVRSVIEQKRDQHSDAININKIYIFDSEFIPDMALPIFATDGMFDRDKLVTYANTLTPNESIFIIRRNYMGHIPEVKIDVFGSDPNLKDRLERLNTNFAFSVRR